MYTHGTKYDTPKYDIWIKCRQWFDQCTTRHERFPVSVNPKRKISVHLGMLNCAKRAPWLQEATHVTHNDRRYSSRVYAIVHSLNVNIVWTLLCIGSSSCCHIVFRFFFFFFYDLTKHEKFSYSNIREAR